MSNLLRVTLRVESRFKDNVTPFSLSRTVAPKMALAVSIEIFDGHFCYPAEKVQDTGQHFPKYRKPSKAKNAQATVSQVRMVQVTVSLGRRAQAHCH